MGGVDLGDAEAARAWVDAAVATYDGIDVLYNNASTQRFGAIDELTVEEWDFTMRNELDLVYYTVRAAWPHLKATAAARSSTSARSQRCAASSSCRRTPTPRRRRA